MTEKAGQMDLSFLIRDNIDEMLVKIIKFTRIRHKIISDNIHNCHLPGFVPKQLNVEEFAMLISGALTEHFKNNRLVLCDSQTVRFYNDGRFDISPEPDTAGAALYRENFAGFMQLQKKRLQENSLNNKIAVALLGQKLREAKQPVE